MWRWMMSVFEVWKITQFSNFLLSRELGLLRSYRPSGPFDGAQDDVVDAVHDEGGLSNLEA